MKNRSLVINLWKVILRDKENFSFYKIVNLNSKVIAISIEQDEFQRLEEVLRPMAFTENVSTMN